MSSPFDFSNPPPTHPQPDNPQSAIPNPQSEAARLEALRGYAVLDTPPEVAFDRITRLAARLFEVPIALVSLVDLDRQWFKSCYGLSVSQTSRDVSFCARAIEGDDVLVIPDATLDARFADNPLVTGEPNVRFYAGAPLRTSQGVALGSLCVIDTRPRQFSEAQRATLTDLAEVVVDELELRLAAQAIEREAVERREAERLLLESEIRFKNAFELSAIGMILTSPTGQCLQVNRKLCELLGYSREQLLQGDYVGLTHPDDLEANLQLVKKALDGEISSYELEKRYLHRDGSVIWTLLSASLVRDEDGAPQGFISQIQDISARKRAEADLRSSEARKAAILDTALDCIITIDTESRIWEWNPAAEKTFGFSRHEAMGAHLHELIVPPELRAAHRAGIETWRQSGVGPILGQRLELPAVRADGSALTVELAIVPIPHSEPPLFTGHLRDISERRASEERLRLLESVAVNANDAILITEAEPIDLPGPRILYANDAYLKMSGYTLEEIMGQTPRILQGEGTLPDARAKIRAALEKWKPVVVEVLNYKKDGTPFWVELSITPVANEKGWFTHWVSVQRDITQSKVTLDALRESEARFGRIAANVPGMVYQFVMRTDGTFQFTYVSEGSREIYGLEPEVIMADAFAVTSWIHPDDMVIFQQSIFDSAQTLEPWEWDGRIQIPGGALKWIRGTSRPKREANGDTIWDGILFDVTQRKLSVEALQIAKDEAEAAREEAERANRAKSEFLSRMSHELRTPLNAILGFGQLLEMADLSEDDAQSSEQIVKAGRHLLDLINEVLDIARIESGQLALSPEAVSAREIALEALDLVRPLAAARGLSIRDQSARDSEAHLRADRQRLKQILLNLLSNAVKYNREGGQITLEIEERGAIVKLCVRDEGEGIAPELLARLGTPFDRLGAENSAIEGTGVGLAVSRHLAEAMGGVLKVESEVGRGSAFWVELPRADDPLARFPALSGGEGKTVISTKAVVLYIEDNPSNLQLVQRVLTHRPEVRLLSAMHGDIGYELACVHCPDLILLDMHLPKMSGHEVLKLLKSNPDTASIPVVALSADVTVAQIERAIAAGAQTYLSKPLDVGEFLACLDRSLRKNDAQIGVAARQGVNITH